MRVSRSRAMPVGDRRSTVRLAWPALLVRVSRSRAMPVRDRRSTVRLVWRALLGRVSRSRAMPVGDRRSSREMGVASVVGAGFALPRDAGRRPALHRDCSRLAMRGFAAVRLVGGGVVGAGFALPRDAGRRPALLGLRATLCGRRVPEREKN